MLIVTDFNNHSIILHHTGIITSLVHVCGQLHDVINICIYSIKYDMH